MTLGAKTTTISTTTGRVGGINGECTGCAGGMYRVCSGCEWGMHRTNTGHARVVHGACMGPTREFMGCAVHGGCLGHAHSSCMGLAWCVHGVCRGHAGGVQGPCNGSEPTHPKRADAILERSLKVMNKKVIDIKIYNTLWLISGLCVVTVT